MEDKNLQVNVNFTNNPELFESLEQMVRDDMTDRSKFIKRLVAQEVARRAQLALPTLEPKKARRAVAA